ncbi:MAG: SRPBCC domain-containing protein [Gemmatimonadetes bacterium]|nr:SRPBCC domain-containing protein [Gemmatimonadota bacterium]
MEQQGTWIWLRVDAIAPVRERFLAQGVRLLGEPRDLGPGWEQLFLDSEGNVLRLYEALNVVERSVDIAAPAEAVWSALTQAAAIERWFDAIDDVTFEAHPGGRVAFRDPAFGEVEGTVTAWEPVTRLAVEFRQNWPRLLEYRLTPVAGGTRLAVVQRDFGPVRERDFGIPGMIEHLDQALALLATLAKAGALAVSAADLARTVRDQLKSPN